MDHWKKEHVENKVTGEHDLIESYNGKVEIDRTEEYKYLGFIISSKGNNMVNIKEVRKNLVELLEKCSQK